MTELLAIPNQITPDVPPPVGGIEANKKDRDKNRKKAEELSDQLLNYLIDNYCDDEGNFSWWKEFEFSDNENNRANVQSRLEEIQAVNRDYDNDNNYDHELSSLESFLYSPDTMDKIVKKYQTEQDLLRKIKIIKLCNDIAHSLFRDDWANNQSINKAINGGKKIKDSPEEEYLVRTYAKVKYLSNLDWYITDHFLDSKDFDEEFAGWFDIRKLHEARFDVINFQFDDRMINAMNSCSQDYGSPSQIMNSGDALPLHQIPAGSYYADDVLMPGGDTDANGKLEYWYQGDYITAELAPGIVGVYTVNGDLLGWHEYDESLIDSKNKEIEKIENLLANRKKRGGIIDLGEPSTPGPLKIGLNQPQSLLDRIGQGNKNDLALFKIMANLEFRSQIKKDLGIDIGNFNLRTQFQFLNFIKNANEGSINNIKNFLSQAGEDADKANRIKTFLSLESGETSGNKILNIGEQLKNHPQTADLLFSEYAQLVDKTEQTAQAIERLYKEIFFDKQVDKDEISRAILKRASKLLLDAAEKLKDTPEDDKPAIVKELVEELIREQMAQARMLEDFKAIAFKLNRNNDAINIEYKNIMHNIWKADIKAKKMAGESEEEIEEYMEYLDTVRDMRFDPAAAWSMDEAKEMLDEEKKDHRFDAQRIKDLIAEMEKRKDEPGSDPKLFAGFIKKLQATLDLQAALEQKLEQIIYSRTGDKDETVEPSLPSAILAKYNELVNLITRSKKELAGLFKEEVGIEDEDLDEITQSILRKAKECLNYFTACIDKGEDIDKDAVLRQLEGYQADLILQFSVRKRLAHEKSLSPDDLKGVSFERLTAKELISENGLAALDQLTQLLLAEKPALPASSLKGAVGEFFAQLQTQEKKSLDYVHQMMRMYEDNYKDKPDKQPLLLKDFRDALHNGDQTVIYMYRKGDKILAFVRYEKTGANKKFVASLNALPSLSGFDMGMPLFSSSLEMELAGTEEIEADADPYRFVTPRYVEKNGFVVKRTFVKNRNPYFKISLADTNKNYGFKDLKKFPDEEIIRLGEQEPDASGNNFVLKFKPNAKELFATTEDLTSRGYVLTRYIIKNGWAYLAFEKEVQN